jgi:hypothetical protein
MQSGLKLKAVFSKNLLICDVLTHYKFGSYLFSFIFSIQNSDVNYLFFYFDSNISVTIQNCMHVPMDFYLLIMTDTITPPSNPPPQKKHSAFLPNHPV